MDLLGMVFNIVINLATLLIFLRFIMQLSAVDPYNPVVMSTFQATRIVDVFNRILPVKAGGRLNIAALVLLVLLALISIAGNHLLNGVPPPPPLELVFMVLFEMVQQLLSFCRILLIASIILSWVVAFTQSQSPYIGVVMQLSEPLLAPFRRILPDTGPLDLSPVVAFLAIYICEQLVANAAAVVLP